MVLVRVSGVQMQMHLHATQYNLSHVILDTISKILCVHHAHQDAPLVLVLRHVLNV